MGFSRWSQLPVVVAGSAPSLTTKQVRHIAKARLADKCRVIAVNDAVYPLWGVADWLHSCDYKWWGWHIQAVAKFIGIKTTLSDALPREWNVEWMETSGEYGFDDRLGRVFHGNNGGYQAVHCALQVSPPSVLMVGIDCKGTKHFFGDHPDQMWPDWSWIAKGFVHLKEPAARRGTVILNCSPDSAVDAFDLAKIEDVL